MKINENDKIEKNLEHLVYKAARILYLGLKKPTKLYKDNEYRGLYNDLRENNTILLFLEKIMEALEFYPPQISQSRLQLIPKPKSIFSIQAKDIPGFYNEDPQKILPILLIGIANYYFGGALGLKYSVSSPSLTKEKLYTFIEEIVEKIDVKKENVNAAGENVKFYHLFQQFHKVSERERSNVFSYIDSLLKNLEENNLIFVEKGEFLPSAQFKDQINELRRNPYFIAFSELRKKIQTNEKTEQKKTDDFKNKENNVQDIAEDKGTINEREENEENAND